MPTYQYACTDCGHRFEQVQSFADAALAVCPECGGKLRKVYGSVGVVFKGSGFYRNDARSAGKKGGGGSDAPATPSGDKPAAKDTTSAPAASTPAPAATSTSSSTSSKSGAAAS